MSTITRYVLYTLLYDVIYSAHVRVVHPDLTPLFPGLGGREPLPGVFVVLFESVRTFVEISLVRIGGVDVRIAE